MNTAIYPIHLLLLSLGHPGTLPKFNTAVLDHAIRLGSMQLQYLKKCTLSQKLFTLIYQKDINNSRQNPFVDKESAHQVKRWSEKQ